LGLSVRWRRVDGGGRVRLRPGDGDAAHELPDQHDQPLGFTPYPTVPPLPVSPTDDR